jgi:hypothetical protein
MTTINMTLILTKLKYIKIDFKNPAEYLRPYCYKDSIHRRVSGMGKGYFEHL